MMKLIAERKSPYVDGALDGLYRDDQAYHWAIADGRMIPLPLSMAASWYNSMWGQDRSWADRQELLNLALSCFVMEPEAQKRLEAALLGMSDLDTFGVHSPSRGTPQMRLNFYPRGPKGLLESMGILVSLDGTYEVQSLREFLGARNPPYRDPADVTHAIHRAMTFIHQAGLKPYEP